MRFPNGTIASEISQWKKNGLKSDHSNSLKFFWDNSYKKQQSDLNTLWTGREIFENVTRLLP